MYVGHFFIFHLLIKFLRKKEEGREIIAMKEYKINAINSLGIRA